MSTSECQLFGCQRGNWLQNLQFESEYLQRWSCVSLLGCSWYSKQLSQICSSDLKGWSSNPIANSWAFVYFHASVMCPSRNFENSRYLSKSTKLQTKDIAGSGKQ